MKFIQRLGGPCCEYPLFKIKLSQGSENLVDLSVNESYKNHAVIITPKEGYSANKMSVTVNGKTITPENGVFSFIMPSGNVNVVVTDTRNDLEKVQDLLTFAGYTENQKLFTQGRYIWMEGSNEDSEIKAIILADDTNYLKTSVLGNTGEEVVSQLASSRIIQNVGQYLTSLRTLDSYEYYMPESVNTFIGEEIEVIEDPYQGFEYVEIDGIKWATMNVGAMNIADSGLYFQWGDAQGYTASEVGSEGGKKYFDWEDYKYGDGTSSPNYEDMTKYSSVDNKAELDLEDDAAYMNWGGLWRTPEIGQFYGSLRNATTSEWVSDYEGSGVSGLLLKSKDDSTKKLFFPAVGYCYQGNINYINDTCFCWSKTLSANGKFSYNITLESDNTTWSDTSPRCVGISIRPIIDTNA